MAFFTQRFFTSDSFLTNTLNWLIDMLNRFYNNAILKTSLVNAGIVKGDANGDLVSVGAQWDDLTVEANVVKLRGTNDPTFEAFLNNGGASVGTYLYYFSPTAVNEVFFSKQFPHSWNQGQIRPHVHWVPENTADGNPANQKVKWGLEYTWANVGTTYGNTASILYATDHIPNDANVVADRHYISSFPAITPSASQNGYSSMIVARLFRAATDAEDNYEHKAGLLEIDFHIQKVDFGTDTEFA